MMSSLERFGQLNPVSAVQGQNQQLILIDGYLRVEALRRLGSDTVLTEIWPCQEQEALIRLLAGSQQRHWDAIEQATLIQQLKCRFQCSLSDIARRIGRDLSWVSRRLSLIEALSEDLLDAVLKGHISTWAASRVLAPLARANAEHAEALSRSLVAEPMGTRDLAEFFRHYQKANAKRRQKMVQQPSLFLRALRAQEQQSEEQALREGPEGQWLRDLKSVRGILARLRRALPQVISTAQNEDVRFFAALDDAFRFFLALKEDIQRIKNHDSPSDPRSHPVPVSEGDQTPPNQPTAGGLQKYCETGHPRAALPKAQEASQAPGGGDADPNALPAVQGQRGAPAGAAHGTTSHRHSL